MSAFTIPSRDPAVIAAALAAPFRDDELKYRAGRTYSKGNVKYTVPLVYIDARTAVARLDAVLGPDGWSSEITFIGTGVYSCKLTVHALGGVTRMDVGQAGEHETEREKSGVSDAIKRAAAQLGVGRYLYGVDLAETPLEQRNGSWVLPKDWRPHAHVVETVTFNAPVSATRGKPLTDAQFNRLQKDMRQMGLTPADLWGDTPLAELTSAQASQWITRLSEMAGRNHSLPA
jgi:hypothetical protein